MIPAIPIKVKKKNATGLDIIDNLVGTSGIKTDVSLKIAPATIPIIIVSVMIAVIAGIVIAGVIQKALKQ